MDPKQAQQALDDIRVGEEQALRTAFKSPWWMVAGVAVGLLCLGAGFDMPSVVRSLVILIVALGIIRLQRVADRWSGAPLHRSRHTRRTRAFLLGTGLLLTAILAASWLVLDRMDVPLPGTISGGIVALVSVVLHWPTQRFVYANVRRAP